MSATSDDADWAGLGGAIADFNAARDWGQFHDPKSLVVALTGELGELASHFQWLTPAESDAVTSDPVKLADVQGELADVAIYLLTLAHRLDVNLPKAVLEKLAENERRYPVERSRGRSNKYDQI